MSNKTMALLLISIPISGLISYVLFKVYNKNVPPSIVGMSIILLYALVQYVVGKKNENP